MVVLNGIVLPRAPGNFSNWVSGMGEKLRSEVRTASTFQPNPMVPCKSIGIMRHPVAGRSLLLKPRPGPIPGDAHDVLHLKSVHGKYLSAQPDGTAQWNRDHAPPGGWEDIQFVPQVTQNQEQVSIKHQEPIEILEAVTGRPIRFRLNNPPNNNHAWVGIYPPSAYDQNHGAENNRWKWLRNIDVNNASFPKQVAGSHSIRVFSDGYRLYASRKEKLPCR